ncbi:unnamed protein product [Polarella glacialis]|uniref:Uncharacterized protein n=1 Tax=Polarella glacialis TaxID=89957 RepID=A0A813FPP4_POLGL|nr:unnamed protein product [Polarella glacialis]
MSLGSSSDTAMTAGPPSLSVDQAVRKLEEQLRADQEELERVRGVAKRQIDSARELNRRLRQELKDLKESSAEHGKSKSDVGVADASVPDPPTSPVMGKFSARLHSLATLLSSSRRDDQSRLLDIWRQTKELFEEMLLERQPCLSGFIARSSSSVKRPAKPMAPSETVQRLMHSQAKLCVEAGMQPQSTLTTGRFAAAASDEQRHGHAIQRRCKG